MATLKKFVPPVEFHPGITLSDKLKEMGMSVKEFAVRTSKPEKTIFAVIGGKSSVTSDMAVAFESVTKIPAHFWLNIQRGYDEYVARQKREEHRPLPPFPSVCPHIQCLPRICLSCHVAGCVPIRGRH